MMIKTITSFISWENIGIQPVRSEGDQPWDFFGRNDAKAETPVLWPPHVKSWLIGKDSDARRDWGQEEKGTTEDEKSRTRMSDWTELNWTGYNINIQNMVVLLDTKNGELEHRIFLNDLQKQ